MEHVPYEPEDVHRGNVPLGSSSWADAFDPESVPLCCADHGGNSHLDVHAIQTRLGLLVLSCQRAHASGPCAINGADGCTQHPAEADQAITGVLPEYVTLPLHKILRGIS